MDQLTKGSLRELVINPKPHQEISSSCRIRATNDAEAVERWLDEYFLKPTTFRTYKKEAERFLVWCVKVRAKSLKALNRDDVEAYIEFVKNPVPKEVWCGPRRKKNQEPNAWYPFAGPLSVGATRSALTILNSMMAYLVDARYVDFNPFSLIRKKSRFKESMTEQAFFVAERILNHEEWQALQDCLELFPKETKEQIFTQQRLKFLVYMLFFLGLRIDEVMRALWRDCQNLNGKWWFVVRGKGDRLGKIPINRTLLHCIMEYRHVLGKAPLPTLDDISPLIFSYKNREKPLTVRQMSNWLKTLGEKAAQKFDENSLSHKKLLKFSPHWLRHLSASKQDLAGISFTNIKSNMRHQNEQTTRLYVHAHDDDRHKEMEKLSI